MSNHSEPGIKEVSSSRMLQAADRERIVQAARGLVKAGPCLNASRQELARLAEVSPYEISRHFRDKRSLMAELVRTADGQSRS